MRTCLRAAACEEKLFLGKRDSTALCRGNVNFCRQLVRLQREHNNANSAEPAKRRERPSPPHRAAQAGVEMTRLGSPSSRSGGGSASNRDAQREVRPSERPRFRAIASSRPCSTLSSNRSVPDASATTRPRRRVDRARRARDVATALAVATNPQSGPIRVAPRARRLPTRARNRRPRSSPTRLTNARTSPDRR